MAKSTWGVDYIPENITVLDPDSIAQRYKENGFTDYKDIGNLRFNDLVRTELISGNSFAIELNLGYQSHYDFVKSLKTFSSKNIVEIILFNTDDISICLSRAKLRHEHGMHLVPPETVREMYNNTLPLLRENFFLLDTVTAINVASDAVTPENQIYYNKTKEDIKLSGKLSFWIKDGLMDLLPKLSVKKGISKPKIKKGRKI